jgi:hypothetical protein
MSRIKIKAGGITVEGLLNDRQGAMELLEALPLKGTGNRWGEEIYFDIDVCLTCDNPTVKVKPGDIAFWPAGNGLALFFGRTPLSTGPDPVPASEVEIVGRLLGDFSVLDGVPDGAEIIIDKWTEA